MEGRIPRRCPDCDAPRLTNVCGACGSRQPVFADDRPPISAPAPVDDYALSPALVAAATARRPPWSATPLRCPSCGASTIRLVAHTTLRCTSCQHAAVDPARVRAVELANSYLDACQSNDLAPIRAYNYELSRASYETSELMAEYLADLIAAGDQRVVPALANPLWGDHSGGNQIGKIRALWFEGGRNRLREAMGAHSLASTFAKHPIRRRPNIRRLVWVLGSGAAVVAIAGAAMMIHLAGSGSPRSSSPSAPSPSSSPSSPGLPRSPATRTPTRDEQIAHAPTFAEAIAIAAPDLEDEVLAGSGRALATYASAKLGWADVDVPAETTIGHVLKDPTVVRGKRLCASGAIDWIERHDLGARKAHSGKLTTADGDEIVFVAVGSTGELVKRSTARLCGIAIGRVDRAASLLGMFDLPENAHPAVEQ